MENKHGIQVDKDGLMYYKDTTGEYRLIKEFKVKRKWYKESIYKFKNIFKKKECDYFE